MVLKVRHHDRRAAAHALHEAEGHGDRRGVNSSEGVDTAVVQLLAAWKRRCMHTYTCTYVSLCKHHTSYM